MPTFSVIPAKTGIHSFQHASFQHASFQHAGPSCRRTRLLASATVRPAPPPAPPAIGTAPAGRVALAMTEDRHQAPRQNGVHRPLAQQRFGSGLHDPLIGRLVNMGRQILHFQHIAETERPAVIHKRRRDQPGANEGRIAPQIGVGVAPARHLFKGDLFERIGLAPVRQARQHPRQGQTDPGRNRTAPQRLPVLLGSGRQWPPLRRISQRLCGIAPQQFRSRRRQKWPTGVSGQ